MISLSDTCDLPRYAPGFNPTAAFSLNGAPAPACEEPPACSGVTTTPAPGTAGAAAEDDHGCTVEGTCPEGTLCTVTGMSIISKVKKVLKLLEYFV